MAPEGGAGDTLSGAKGKKNGQLCPGEEGRQKRSVVTNASGKEPYPEPLDTLGLAISLLTLHYRQVRQYFGKGVRNGLEWIRQEKTKTL